MLSRNTYIICVLLVLYAAVIFKPKWEGKAGETSLGWDASTYYWYLPATFIYNDLKQHKFGDSIIAKYDFTPDYEQTYQHQSGNRVITYSSGLAFMHLPAFVLAHFLAEPLGYPADGFSLPYQVAVQLWSLFCALIGLWLFRRLLLYYYSDTAVAITLLLLVFGSNYLNYVGFDVTLTHSWLFSLYVLLMLNTRSFYLQPSYKYAIRIGLLTGLIILIRPSEMIAALIPLLWGMERISISAIKDKLQFLWKQSKYIAVTSICTIAIGSIQIIYWLYVTGQPLVYSYAEKGFSWLHPHFKDYTLSYRSGWLTYTPLLVFAFIGLIPFLFKGKNKVAIISFFLLNYYIVAAWDIWWYGGMGGRAMVQSYAILFFPIAALVEYLLSTKWIKWPVFAAMALCAYVNIWFTYNAHVANGLYDPQAMTKAYYWNVVGRFDVPKQTIVLKDTDELFEGTPKNMKQLFSYGFEDDSLSTNIDAISGDKSMYMGAGREYGPNIIFAYQPNKADWLRAKVKVKAYDYEPDNWRMIQYIVMFLNGSKEVKSRMIRLNRFAQKEKLIDAFFDVKIPEEEFDSVKIIFWNPGSSKPMKIDDVEILSFND